MKGFYCFRCPLGANDVKIGITSHFEVRLGSYQNSYSRNSYVARFDLVYLGDDRAIASLEKIVKQRYNWAIERDGRGASEWISNHSVEEIERIVDGLIAGHKFKITKVPKDMLPVTIDNLNDLNGFRANLALVDQ